MVMMVWPVIVLPACAAVAPDTAVIISIISAGSSPLAIDDTIPTYHEPGGISSLSPGIQERQFINHTGQNGLVLSEWIAPAASRTGGDIGGVEDEVTQQVVLHNNRVGISALELPGVDRHLLRNSHFIRDQGTERVVLAAGNMVDGPAEALANLLDELYTAERSFRFEYQIPTGGAIRLKSQFEFQQ